MTQKDRREKMDKALKEIVVPFLRENGFKGSYPNFRRINNGKLELFNFQFSTSLESRFVAQISFCDVNGITTSWGEKIEPKNCKVNDTDFNKRHRLGSLKHNCDYWYNFQKPIIIGNVYKKRAKEVIENWSEAEYWWNEKVENK